MFCATLIAFCAVDARADDKGLQLTSLRLMREKGVISSAEYDSAMKDIADTAGAKAADAPTFILSRFSTTLYGFVESDMIHDSTQSFVDLQGNNLAAKSSTYAGSHGRTQFGVRNSRLGLRLKAPEYHAVRVSGILEMDFLGTELPIGYAQPYQESEASFWTNPALRVRHANVKIETDVVDVMLGQSWELFGWQPFFHPNSVEIQGLPGQIYSRTPQLRVSKTIKTSKINVDLAVAAMRPPDRDGEVPEGQAGLRLSVNGWTGGQTMGATGTAISPLSIGLSGDARYLSVPQFSAAPKGTVSTSTGAFAVDVFVPILPASDVSHLANALSLNGEFVTGYGISDLYTGLNGGVTFPALPNPGGATPAPAYPQALDNGIATIDATGNLQAVQWTSGLVGAQYYLPGVDGKVWVSANFSHLQSSNGPILGTPAKTLSSSNWADGNVFVDVVPGFRVGAEYARTWDTFGDAAQATNDRVQVSAFLIF